MSEIFVLSHREGKQYLDDFVSDSKLKVYRLFDSSDNIQRYFAFLKIFKKIKKLKPDIVHFEYPPKVKNRFGGLLGEPLLLLFLLLKIEHVPFFVTLHSIILPRDVEFRTYEMTGSNLLSKLAKYYFYIIMYLLGTMPQKLFLLVTHKNSKLITLFSKSYGIPLEKLREELHGLSLEHNDSSRSGDTKNIARPKRLVCLGFISPTKGYEHIISAMKIVSEKHPDSSLIIAGVPVSEEGKKYTEKLKNLIQQFSLNKSVTIEDRYLSDKEFKNYVRTAYAIILPYSRVMGASGIMTLAISNQIPVVAAASGPLFEELADTLVVVPPSDHEALAEEIIRLLEDKQYRKILTDKYQKYIVDHDWSLVVRAIYEEYVKGAQLKQRFNK